MNLKVIKTAITIFAMLTIPMIVGITFLGAFGMLVGWCVGGCLTIWWVISQDNIHGNKS